MMQEQVLGAEEDFEMCTQDNSTDPQERQFNQIVMCLQQVILDEEFQSTQTLFMKQNCDFEMRSPAEIEQLFNQYRNTITQLLHNKIYVQLPTFNFNQFALQLKARDGQVDQEIADIVLSCMSIDSFKALLNDYKVAEQEQERYRVLTVKTNKLPENKKIKGNSENIFGTSNVPTFGLTKNPTKKSSSSKISQKTIDQVFVPETVLTVKGLRKC